uniref:Cystatin domain-containing protein n=1 Tax=Equus asinus TaxID=9793 RepID=A0A9L0IIW2_EQUAS
MPRLLRVGGALVIIYCRSRGPRSLAALRVHTRSPFPPPPTARMMCGAPSATQPATAETQAIADQVRSQLEEKENKKFPIFKAVEFRSQVVAGTNHFIKVQVGDDDFVHIRVFKSLPHENKPPALSSYQTNKARHTSSEDGDPHGTRALFKLRS